VTLGEYEVSANLQKANLKAGGQELVHGIKIDYKFGAMKENTSFTCGILIVKRK
jgi:hypothetical protein